MLSPLFQNSTLNTHQGHHQQHTANSMSSSADLSPQSSVCAGADCLDQSHYVDDDSAPISSLSARPIRPRLPLRGLALLLFGTLVLVAVAVGVSKIRAKPTLHVVFPGKDIVSKLQRNMADLVHDSINILGEPHGLVRRALG